MDEEAFKVVYGEEGVECTRPDGIKESVLWGELESVTVEATQAEGAPPHIWILWGKERKSGVVYPGRATGSAELLGELRARLEGFDSKALSEALASPENRTYQLWHREVLPERKKAGSVRENQDEG